MRPAGGVWGASSWHGVAWDRFKCLADSPSSSTLHFFNPQQATAHAALFDARNVGGVVDWLAFREWNQFFRFSCVCFLPHRFRARVAPTEPSG